MSAARRRPLWIGAAACALTLGCAPRRPAAPVNPILPKFLADPSAHVFGGRVYVYLTNDSSNTEKYWDSTNWRLLSSADMTRWQDHGVVLSLRDIAWAKQYAWAPAAVERNGTYYLYVPVDRTRMAVASAPSPTGPFRDARGEPILDKARDANTGAEPIDPMVFVDDDGQAYMYFGSRTPKVVRLAPDMVRMDGEIRDVPLDRKNFGEAPWLHKHGGVYFFTYSTGWPGQIVYATGTSPLGPFTYRGVVLDYTNVSTNHAAIVRKGDAWWVFYHNASLPGGGNYKRSVNVDRLYHEADGSIRRVVPTGGGALPGRGPEPARAP